MKKKKILLAFLICIACVFTVTGCGDEEGDSIYNFSDTAPKQIDPWVYLTDSSLSDIDSIKDFASSAGALAMTVGIIGIVFSILFMAIRMLFSSSAKAKAEVKEEALVKGLIAIMLFSIPLWLGICKLISDLLV